MESVIVKFIGIVLRFFFFRKGINDVMMDNILFVKVDEGGKENYWVINVSII